MGWGSKAATNASMNFFEQWIRRRSHQLKLELHTYHDHLNSSRAAVRASKKLASTRFNSSRKMETSAVGGIKWTVHEGRWGMREMAS